MNFQDRATYHAQQQGIDPALFHALITQESGWNPAARSHVGAYGLTQAMPATAAKPGFGVSPLEDMDDPDEQLRFGAEYLDAMLDRYDGDVDKALAAYNWGAGNADRWSGDKSQLPEETRKYIAAITGNPVARAGPTQARADAGLPLAQAKPKDPWMQEEYADNWLGRTTEKKDKMRAGLGDKLGMTSDQMEGIGGGLHGLGQYLLAGGLR